MKAGSDLKRLQTEAAQASGWHGHALGKWGTNWNRDGLRITSIAGCTRCKCGVMVDTRPPANGIDIGGSAVAVGCEAS